VGVYGDYDGGDHNALDSHQEISSAGHGHVSSYGLAANVA
jgi:hypothetical protein